MYRKRSEKNDKDGKLPEIILDEEELLKNLEKKY